MSSWLLAILPFEKYPKDEPTGSGNREDANVAASDGLKPNAPHPTYNWYLWKPDGDIEYDSWSAS